MGKSMFFTVRWEPNEEWLGGWEPVEVLEGKCIPPDQGAEVWYCVEVVPSEQTRIINPSGVPLYINFTPLCPTPGRN